MDLNRNDIIEALVSLGKAYTSPSMDSVLERAYLENNWFTQENVALCLNNWSECLTRESLEAWLKDYTAWPQHPKTVGIIMAGNIPLVGLHDLLCVLLSGHCAKVKLAQNDEVLMKYSIEYLIGINSKIRERIEISERIIRPDAVIATGSNNTARYFEYYYRDIPKIIRKNRTSVAVLDGKETIAELERLADDVFQYFGLGCRNVTKLMVPQDYDLTPLLDCSQKYAELINHNKFANNYTYHRAIFLMNLTKHLDTGYLLVKEDESLHSPLACLFYEKYNDGQELSSWLSNHNDEIQVLVSHMDGLSGQPFGTTQQTQLSDYADGVNTLDFLNAL